MILTKSRSNSIVNSIWIWGEHLNMSENVCASVAKEKGSFLCILFLFFVLLHAYAYTDYLNVTCKIWHMRTFKWVWCAAVCGMRIYYLFLSDKCDVERAPKVNRRKARTKWKVRRKWCWWWCWKSETIETNLLQFKWTTVLAWPVREGERARVSTKPK